MKPVLFSEHALLQMGERGASREEVIGAISQGLGEPAKRGRVMYRRNFEYNSAWAGRHYAVKQVCPVVVEDKDRLVVVTVYTFYF